MSLREYNRKRKFQSTPEPKGKPAGRKGALRFVVQLHRASRLHYDFRLEMGGSFKSWAVPRGPSLNPMDQRLAVFVEDHPIPYGSFEGIIPRGNYGAGTVMIWDQGTYEERRTGDSGAAGEKAMLEGLERGHITFVLQGEKLNGEFALIRLKRGDEKAWLLVKKRDGYSTYKTETETEEEARSAVTGRTMAEIAAQSEKKGDVWLPKRKQSKLPTRAPKRTTSNRAETATATQAAMPRRVKPMLPRLARGELARKGWLFCRLAGGLRAIAEVEPHRVSIHSKTLMPFEVKFPKIAEALADTDVRVVLDGEISRDGKRYHVFDLLFIGGEDLRSRPLRERLARLKKLAIFGKTILLCEQVVDDGSRLSDEEGEILARDSASVYQSGVSPDWLEIRGSPASAGSERAGKRPASAGKRPAPASALERGPVFTHLGKVYWKREGITKGDLIDYYREVGPALLPHLADRPMSLHRFPNGSESAGFYQKDFTGYKPRFIETHRLFSESAGKSVDYVVCQNESTLLYLANLGCIEMNPWLSRKQDLEKPDYLVIDLDPDRQSFAQVVEVALEVRKVLDQAGAESFCKTSGATGMHICVPLQAGYDYEVARDFAEAVCRAVNKKHPAITTLERNPSKRGGRMYLDFMQNRIGQTLASPYSVRPRPGAPVSAPLRWSEVTRKLDPTAFTMATMPKRLDRLGDLWKPMLKRRVDIRACFERL